MHLCWDQQINECELVEESSRCAFRCLSVAFTLGTYVSGQEGLLGQSITFRRLQPEQVDLRCFVFGF
jgi:hypothetical protein